MLKAVLFDFDGLLTTERTGSRSIVKQLSRIAGVDRDVLKLSYARFNKALLLGEITHQDILEKLSNDAGVRITYENMTEAFRRAEWDEDMLALVKRLKERCLVGLVTDNKCDRIQAALQAKGLEGSFDQVAVSAACHSRKDDSRIFQWIIHGLGVLPQECAFVDNNTDNLIAPRKMGVHTIFFDDRARDVEGLEKELEALLP